MAIITKSDKLVTTDELDQTKMVSEQYVLVSIIHETISYTLMTATAKEHLPAKARSNEFRSQIIRSLTLLA